MPTVLRAEGFRVLILYPPREHPPPHVHVVRGDGLVVIVLGGHHGAQRTTRVIGMTAAERRAAERLVSRHTQTLIEAWRQIHGTDNS